MIGEDCIKGLRHGEAEEEHSCNQRDDSPRIRKVVAHEPRPPLVAFDVGIRHHVPEQLAVVVLLVVEIRTSAEVVEELGHLLVLAELALDDVLVLEHGDVRRRVDEAVHERRVAGEVAPRGRTALLERYQVAELGDGSLLDWQHRDLHDAGLFVKPDIQEARRVLPPPKLNSRVPEMGGGGDPSRRSGRRFFGTASAGPAAVQWHLTVKEARQKPEERSSSNALHPFYRANRRMPAATTAAARRTLAVGRADGCMEHME